MTKKIEPVFHYTYSHPNGKRGSIDAILESGVLLPPCLTPQFHIQEANARATIAGDKRVQKAFDADSKCLLFSQRTDWEPASFRGVGQTVLTNLEDYAKHGISAYRISVDRSILHPYMKLMRLVRMPSWMQANLAKIARDCGSDPYDWFGC